MRENNIQAWQFIWKLVNLTHVDLSKTGPLFFSLQALNLTHVDLSKTGPLFFSLQAVSSEEFVQVHDDGQKAKTPSRKLTYLYSVSIQKLF
jgi:hypothetical protein